MASDPPQKLISPAAIIRPRLSLEQRLRSNICKLTLPDETNRILKVLESELNRIGGELYIIEDEDEGSDYELLPYIFEFLGRTRFTVAIKIADDKVTKNYIEQQLAIVTNFPTNLFYIHSLHDFRQNRKIRVTFIDVELCGYTKETFLELLNELRDQGLISEFENSVQDISEKWIPVLRIALSDIMSSKEVDKSCGKSLAITLITDLATKDRYSDNKWIIENSKETTSISGWIKAFTVTRPHQNKLIEDFKMKNLKKNSIGGYQFYSSIESMVAADPFSFNKLGNLEAVVLEVRLDKHYLDSRLLGKNGPLLATSMKAARPTRLLMLTIRRALSITDALSRLFRCAPTPEEQSQSKELIENVPDTTKIVVDQLESILQSVNGHFLLSKQETNLELLPHVFTRITTMSEKKTLEIKFSMNIDDRESAMKGIDIGSPLFSGFVYEIKRKIAQSTDLMIEEIIVHEITSENEHICLKISVPTSTNTSAIANHFSNATIFEVAESLRCVLNLKESDFDIQGNSNNFRGELDHRGGMRYQRPSHHWVRIGLKVSGRYDNGNDDWLAMDGRPGEWAVGFHGSSLDGTKCIATTDTEGERKINPGKRQACKDVIDTNTLGDNEGKPCGEGSYFAENIGTAWKYAYRMEKIVKIANGESRENTQTEWERKPPVIQGDAVIMVFQVRLNPRKVRTVPACADKEELILMKVDPSELPFLIAPDVTDARPYGICLTTARPKEETSIFEQLQLELRRLFKKR